MAMRGPARLVVTNGVNESGRSPRQARPGIHGNSSRGPQHSLALRGAWCGCHAACATAAAIALRWVSGAEPLQVVRQLLPCDKAMAYAVGCGGMGGVGGVW